MAAKKLGKPIYRNESPYSSVQVEKLPQPDHDVVVELLVNFLAPVGSYRVNVPRSKRKTDRKRKRDASSPTRASAEGQPVNQESSRAAPTHNRIIVGFNQVARHLETLTSRSHRRFGEPENDSTHDAVEEPRHVVAVFLLRPLDGLIYSNLPTLCCMASAAHEELSPTRLIILDPKAEGKVVDALQLGPSVSILAVLDGEEDVPHIKALTDYVKEHVDPLHLPWLKEAMEARWMGSKWSIQ